jgi:pimeloyl-ACP methyl ester carboxylesterase
MSHMSQKRRAFIVATLAVVLISILLVVAIGLIWPTQQQEVALLTFYDPPKRLFEIQSRNPTIRRRLLARLQNLGLLHAQQDGVDGTAPLQPGDIIRARDMSQSEIDAAMNNLILPAASAATGTGSSNTSGNATNTSTSTSALGPWMTLHALRILYCTQTADGEMTVSSGAIFWLTVNLRHYQRALDIVAWAHPTVGMGETCSRLTVSQQLTAIPGSVQLLLDDKVIVATDYAGLGTPGTLQYMVGSAEANDVLNSVRAVNNLGKFRVGELQRHKRERAKVAASLHVAHDKFMRWMSSFTATTPMTRMDFDADLSSACDLDALQQIATSNRFAAWGHSQGAHACLFAAERIQWYAPELKLVSVAVAAPPVELKLLLDQQFQNPISSWALGPEFVIGWQSARPSLPLQGVLTDVAIRHYARIATICIDQLKPEILTRKLLGEQFFATNPSDNAEWASMIAEQTPQCPPPNIPTLIVQGTADALVSPAAVATYARKCDDLNHDVQIEWFEKVGHADIAAVAAPRVTEWISGSFRQTTASPFLSRS